MVDPTFNSFIELQAIGRAHRIGQKRPVRVHRLIVPDTVEEQVLQRGKEKIELIGDILQEGNGKAKDRGRMNFEDIKFMLLGNGDGKDLEIEAAKGMDGDWYAEEEVKNWWDLK